MATRGRRERGEDSTGVFVGRVHKWAKREVVAGTAVALRKLKFYRWVQEGERRGQGGQGGGAMGRRRRPAPLTRRSPAPARPDERAPEPTGPRQPWILPVRGRGCECVCRGGLRLGTGQGQGQGRATCRRAAW